MKAQIIEQWQLPPVYHLDSDKVNGTLQAHGRRWRLYQPVSQCNGMYVYVPID